MAKAEPLDEIQWKSPEWIQQFGLHTENVLDYFSESPFYDRTSNNQVIKMQFQFQPVPPNVRPLEYMESKLLEMKGVEFVVAYVKEPDFWIVRKQKRLSPHQASVQQDYYIVGANIYQAPKVYDILGTRLLSSVNSIKAALDNLNNMSTFSVSNGAHLYPSVNDAPKAPVGSSTMEDTVSSNTHTGANTMTPVVSTPSVNTPAVGGGLGGAGGGMSTGAALVAPIAAASASSAASSRNHILASTFDGLLHSIISLNEQGTYLDDIPLYGKGSTVEKLDLKVNLG